MYIPSNIRYTYKLRVVTHARKLLTKIHQLWTVRKISKYEKDTFIKDMTQDHSPCSFLDIKFKGYSRSIQGLKTEFSRSIQSKFTLSCTAQVSQNLSPILKSAPNFSELLQFNPTLFPIRTKVQGVFIIFKHFQQYFFFSRAFQGLQGVARTL